MAAAAARYRTVADQLLRGADFHFLSGFHCHAGRRCVADYALPIIAIGVLQAIVAMVTATLSGLDRIPRVMRKSAQMMRMPRWRSALFIELPAALPYLFTGVKLAVAYAFIGVIASEFILSGSGIGYAIAYAYNNFENRDMYALMLFVLLLVTAINMVLNAFDRHFQARRWR
jgi:NitT/TauT family transport system permease protein